jgi:hypothetical protein
VEQAIRVDRRSFHREYLSAARYSLFGIAMDRRHTSEWIFPQEKATFHNLQRVYVYSENALVRQLPRQAIEEATPA